IDDRNGHTFGVGAVHDLTHFGVDGDAVGYALREGLDGKAEGRKKHSQKRKNRFPRSHSDSPFGTGRGTLWGLIRATRRAPGKFRHSNIFFFRRSPSITSRPTPENAPVRLLPS